MTADSLDRDGPTLAFADHGDEPGLAKHHLGELVHPRRRCRTRGPHHFIAYRINGAHVVDDAILKVDREFFSLRQHVDDAFVSSIAAGEELAVEQQTLPGLPQSHFFPGQRVEIHPARFRRRRPANVRPAREVGRIKPRRAGAVETEVGVACRGAVGNNRYRQTRGVCRVIEDLHIDHGRQSTEALCADPQRIDLFVELEPQFLKSGERCAGSRTCLEDWHVDRLHQRFLGKQHRLFG